MRGSTLHKEDLEVVWYLEELSEVVLCFRVDRVERFAAMAHLHNADFCPVPVETLGLGLLEHFFGQTAGSCAEVVNILCFRVFNHGCVGLIEMK